MTFEFYVPADGSTASSVSRQTSAIEMATGLAIKIASIPHVTQGMVPEVALMSRSCAPRTWWSVFPDRPASLRRISNWFGSLRQYIV